MQNFDPHGDPQRGDPCVCLAYNVRMLLGRNSYREICSYSEKSRSFLSISNPTNSHKALCFCGFMTQTHTQLRKVDNGQGTFKQDRRANTVGTNTTQYGYKASVVHSMRTFGSRMPQVRILSLGPKNRLFGRFFFIFDNFS